MENEIKVELLVNPFCMADRDVDTIDNICRENGVFLDIYNTWEIDDNDLPGLPGHLSTLISELRSGDRPGSVYSNVFINGQRIPLNNWPEHLKQVSENLEEALEKQR